MKNNRDLRIAKYDLFCYLCAIIYRCEKWYRFLTKYFNIIHGQAWR